MTDPHVASGSRLHVLIVMGTRPEAIKLAPVIIALRDTSDIEVTVATTGQHQEMLDVVMRDFGVVADLDLDIFTHGQSLEKITAKALQRAAAAIRDRQPGVVLVQGDTTSAFAAALAAFYEGTPIAHVEAGLRTDDRRAPFPEEMNRRLATQLADLHLAPTWTAHANLIRENVLTPVVVTGNTVIDAFLWASRVEPSSMANEVGAILGSERPYVLVTAHRRESWGEPMRRISKAVGSAARAHPAWNFVLPMHSNPGVRADLQPVLGDLPNVLLTEPLPYVVFSHVIARSSFVVTDSGGIQEEAPSLGRPVLVLRDKTERPEGISAGTVRLIGTDSAVVQAEIERLITDPVAHAMMAEAVNPYGDGRAAERIRDALRWMFQGGPLPKQFGVEPDRLSTDPIRA